MAVYPAAADFRYIGQLASRPQSVADVKGKITTKINILAVNLAKKVVDGVDAADGEVPAKRPHPKLRTRPPGGTTAYGATAIAHCRSGMLIPRQIGRSHTGSPIMDYRRRQLHLSIPHRWLWRMNSILLHWQWMSAVRVLFANEAQDGDIASGASPEIVPGVRRVLWKDREETLAMSGILRMIWHWIVSTNSSALCYHAGTHGTYISSFTRISLHECLHQCSRSKRKSQQNKTTGTFEVHTFVWYKFYRGLKSKVTVLNFKMFNLWLGTNL